MKKSELNKLITEEVKKHIRESMIFDAFTGTRISFYVAFVHIYNKDNKTYKVEIDTFSNKSKLHAQAFVDRKLYFYEKSDYHTVINSGIKAVSVDID